MDITIKFPADLLTTTARVLNGLASVQGLLTTQNIVDAPVQIIGAVEESEEVLVTYYFLDDDYETTGDPGATPAADLISFDIF